MDVASPIDLPHPPSNRIDEVSPQCPTVGIAASTSDLYARRYAPSNVDVRIRRWKTASCTGNIVVAAADEFLVNATLRPRSK